jgi:hypothetical protein
VASFSVYRQPDDTWAWRILGEGQRFIMCISPGYPTACDAANAAIPMLGPAFQGLAVRLAASYAERKS